MKKLITIAMMAVILAGAFFAINSYVGSKSNAAQAACGRPGRC